MITPSLMMTCNIQNQKPEIRERKKAIILTNEKTQCENI